MALRPYLTSRPGASQLTRLAQTSASRALVRIAPVQPEPLSSAESVCKHQEVLEVVPEPPSSVESVCKLQEVLEVVQEPPRVDMRIRSRNSPTRRRLGSSEGIWFLGSNATSSWTGSLRLGLSPIGVRDLQNPNDNLSIQLVTRLLREKTPNLSRYLITRLART